MGNSYDFKFRGYNPQTGKFRSIDPLFKKYPSIAPYTFAEDRDIDGVDLEGLEFRNPMMYLEDKWYGKAVIFSIQFTQGTGETVLGALGAMTQVWEHGKTNPNKVSLNQIANGMVGAPLQVANNVYEHPENGANWGALAVFTLPISKYAHFEEVLSDAMPKFHTMSNVEAREWYLTQESKIPGMLDKSASLEKQAKQAFGLRNTFRTTARELMKDQTEAAKLYKDRPNMTWEETIKKYTGKDGKVDYQGIIDASQRSNKEVNQQLGIQKK